MSHSPESTLQLLERARIVPVIRTDSAQTAETAVNWLAEAGFSVFEITLTIPDAVALIGRLVAATDHVIGAGTIMNAADANACLAAGSRFLVSPCIVEEAPALCHAAGAACMLGAMTPSEVRAATLCGADAVKIFPASSVGGPKHIKALKDVFPDTPLVPTGGVSLDSIGTYLDAGAALVGVGGALIDKADIAAGRQDAFVARARRYLDAAGSPR